MATTQGCLNKEIDSLENENEKAALIPVGCFIGDNDLVGGLRGQDG